MIREVLKMGDPRLLEKSRPVEAFGTPQLYELVADMRDTMAHLTPLPGRRGGSGHGAH